jgi:hypothetical protein
MLALDAVLTGAKGVNLWVKFSGRAPPTQGPGCIPRSWSEVLRRWCPAPSCPPTDPFLYTLSFTTMEGTRSTRWKLLPSTRSSACEWQASSRRSSLARNVS